MNASIIVGFLMLGGMQLAAPVLAIIALLRTRRVGRLEQRLDFLDARVDRTEALLNAALRRGATETPAYAEPQPAEEDLQPVPSPPEARASHEPRIETTEPERDDEPGADEPGDDGGSSPPPSGPRASIDWERWIGIRGAALLGAVALGLAGLLLFKYTIEQDLITPAMRVVLGTLTGLGSIVASEGLRRRGYRHVAEGLAGAGAVILYASFWAAHARYALVPLPLTFGLMALVTVVCCLLAVRRKSLVVAALGLVGGFATPLLLASGMDRPIGLFGYVLLLDLGLLAVGYKRRWPSLAALSVLGTVLLQAVWIARHMVTGATGGTGGLFTVVAILAVFGVVFLLAGQLGGRRTPGRMWLWNQIAAIAFPFAFALHLAGRADLGPHLYPVAVLLAALSVAACWLARRHGMRSLGVGAAPASVAVVGVWSLGRALTESQAWELSLTALALAAIFHFLAPRRDAARESDRRLSDAPVLLVLGGLYLLLLHAAARTVVVPWPWIAGWAGMTLVAYRHAARTGRGAWRVAAAAGLGVGLSVLHLATAPVLPAATGMLAVLVAAPLALLAHAVRRRGDAAPQAAAVLAMIVALGLGLSGWATAASALTVIGTLSLLGLLAMQASTLTGRGGWYAAAVGATVLAQSAALLSRGALREQPGELLAVLLLTLVSSLAAIAWPFFTSGRFREDRFAWYAAALAAPAWFPLLRRLFDWRFGEGLIGIVPLALGAVTLLAATRSGRLDAAPAIRRTVLVWFAAVALCFVAVAIPLQLEREWVTLGWALQGLAVIALWKRLDHPGLKYFGLALLGAATVRLVANPALLGYYPRGGLRIFNWLLYTYLVPVAALLGSAALLRTRELSRARGWERIYRSGHAVGALGAGLAAIAVAFVWINLTIADWFATGPALTLSFGDQPAQRLTLSIAWAVYALLLLGVGVARRSLGLRWVSLGFLLVTIFKVFLYDLGALEDLYRVASLGGLAVSLILVSLLYQRFVFGQTVRVRS